jgi:hypothetical protein
MTAFDSYQVYTGIKLHFGSKKYDYFKFDGKTKVTVENFLKRNDRYFFEKISKKYNRQTVKEYFVSNFVANSNLWIGSMTDDNYLEWQRKVQSISYLFRSDLEKLMMNVSDINEAFRCKTTQHPLVLRMYLGKSIMLETLVILNRITNFVNRYDRILENDFIWNEVSLLIKKYDPFLNLNMKSMSTIANQILS